GLRGKLQQNGCASLKFAFYFPGKIGLIVNVETINQVFKPIAALQDIFQLVFGHSHRSEEHTSELQSPCNLVCRLLLEKKNLQILYSSVTSSSLKIHPTAAGASLSIGCNKRMSSWSRAATNHGSLDIPHMPKLQAAHCN